MRVVADANVLVSAALGRSLEAPSVIVLDVALDGRLELVTSPKLLAEVADVLGRPRLRRYLSTDEATRYVDVLAALNDPAEPHAAVCCDSRDDYLVAFAQSSGAEAVVTGDLDLLAIDPNEHEIEILTPRLLVERLAAS